VDIPTLIFCGFDPRLIEMATEAGWKYGAQLPTRVYSEQYGPLYFADQDWKSPDRGKYMAALAEHRPTMATILDWEKEGQLSEVMDWAEEAAQYVERVVLIPKVPGGIERLPRRIGGKDVVLGYSVPTRYGGTPLMLWSFSGWPIHLLGGSPQKQIMCWRYLVDIADVVSADGNMMNKFAMTLCASWVPGTARHAQNRYWPTLDEADGQRGSWGENAPYEAFRRSCHNIMQAWHDLQKEEEGEIP
jgi:hypothetical protein